MVTLVGECTRRFCLSSRPIKSRFTRRRTRRRTRRGSRRHASSRAPPPREYETSFNGFPPIPPRRIDPREPVEHDEMFLFSLPCIRTLFRVSDASRERFRVATRVHFPLFLLLGLISRFPRRSLSDSVVACVSFLFYIRSRVVLSPFSFFAGSSIFGSSASREREIRTP